MRDIDFTSAGIRARWQAGYADAMRTVEQRPWEKPIDPMMGVAVHDPEEDAPEHDPEKWRPVFGKIMLQGRILVIGGFGVPDQEPAADQRHDLDQDVAGDPDLHDAGEHARGIGKARRVDHRST